ncbi:MAG: hypothetical protein IJ640_09190 [Prevotella sp.]|nr:hypothetical protein [Prevotella sp.]
MALIKCKGCGHMISDKAEACPKCGTPNVQEAVEKQAQQAEPTQQEQPQDGGSMRLANIIIGIVVIAFVVGIVYYSAHKSDDYYRNTMSQTSKTEDLSSSNDAISIDNAEANKQTKEENTDNKLQESHALWQRLSGTLLYADFNGAEVDVVYDYSDKIIRECSVTVLGNDHIHGLRLNAKIDNNGSLVCEGTSDDGEIKIVLYPQLRKDNTRLRGEIHIGDVGNENADFGIEEHDEI